MKIITKNKTEILTGLLLKELKTSKFKLNSTFYSENQLCQKYNVSHITVRQALQYLIAKGIIIRIQGKGTFVVRRIKKLSVKKRFIIGLAIYNLDFITSSYYSRLIKGD